MKVEYDRKSDSIYIELRPSPVTESEEVKTDVVLDFDDDGQVVGIEILRAGAHLSEGDLKEVLYVRS